MYSTCEEASKRTAKIIIAFLTMVKLRNVWCIAVIKSLLRVLCLHPAIVWCAHCRNFAALFEKL